MKFGESELLREKNGVRILRIGARNDIEKYCVVGRGRSVYYDDYDDALEGFNLRWLEEVYEE